GPERGGGVGGLEDDTGVGHRRLGPARRVAQRDPGRDHRGGGQGCAHQRPAVTTTGGARGTVTTVAHVGGQLLTAGDATELPTSQTRTGVGYATGRSAAAGLRCVLPQAAAAAVGVAQPSL